MRRQIPHSTRPWMLKPYCLQRFIKPIARRCIERFFPLTLSLSLFASSVTYITLAQSGEHILLGDVKVDESKVEGLKPLNFDIILYTLSGRVVARQTITNNGRYRFLGLRNGDYDLVIEVENSEIGRIRMTMNSPVKTDFRQDISMEWRPPAVGNKRQRPQTVSVADLYNRTSANQSLFEKAQAAFDKKKYEQAISLLHQITNADPKDFQAWTELGTVYLMQNDMGEAEKTYLRAIAEKPSFLLALLNLGRLRIALKNYQGAIEPLSSAVNAQPQSAEANYLLGEAYLQIKKGSKAVGYLNEAIRLDPTGKAEAHLRLAALYNGAGMKDRAAAEYEQFLAKKPDYSNKKKLQQYIAENRRP